MITPLMRATLALRLTAIAWRFAKRSLGRTALVLAVVAALTTNVSQGWAEPSAADKETARRLMKEGRKLDEQKDYAGALKAYQAAHQTMGLSTTGLAVAKTLTALGRLVEARDLALNVARIPAKEGEDPILEAAREEARKLAADLERRIPTVRAVVVVDEYTMYQVKIDGRVLPDALKALPRAVDPGKHVLSATSPGMKDATAEVTVAEGENINVSLKLEKQATTAPSTSTKPVPAAPSSTAGVKATPPHAQGTSALTYISFGVGAAGLIGGAVTGAMSYSKTSDIKESCSDNRCPKELEDDHNKAHLLATVCNISLAVGVIGLGVGIYSLAAAPKDAPKSQASTVRLRPVLGLAVTGLEGSF